MTYPRIPVRRVFRIINGGTPTSDPTNWGGEIPWVTPADLTDTFAVISGTGRNITQEGAKSGSSVVPASSLIISTRAPIGKVAITQREMAFNQGCRALIPHQGGDMRYFGYQFEGLKEQLNSHGLGTTFTELSSEGLASIRVWVPPVEEQRRIADFLDAETSRINAIIAARSKQLTLLQKRLIAYRDTRLDHLYKARPTILLRRLCAGIEQGVSPMCDNTVATSEEWGILKLSSVKSGIFDPDENKLLAEGGDKLSRFAVQDGDLLVTRANTPDLVGDVAVVTGTPRKRLLPDLIYRIKTPSYSSYYLAEVALGSKIRSLARIDARGSSQTMVKLRGEDILRWPIPQCDPKTQNQVASDISRVRNKTDEASRALQQQMRVLEERRRALITAAVTGEFDVSTASGRGIED